MRQILATSTLLLGFLACVLAGCGGGEEGGQAQPAAPGKLPPKVVNVKNLPPLEDPLPAQDEGRVEVAGPKTWRPMSRRESYVAGFSPGSGSTPPRVLVRAKAAPAGSPAAVSAENIAAFETYIEPVLAEELKGKKDIREPVRMLIIGDRPWARYVRIGSMQGQGVERQFLVTVANGRLYTVELQVFMGQLLDHRDSAYAIAGGMRFLKTAAAAGEGEGDDSLGDLLGESGQGDGGDDGGTEDAPGEDEAGGEDEGEGA
jgi:hypothetical protein